MHTLTYAAPSIKPIAVLVSEVKNFNQKIGLTRHPDWFERLSLDYSIEIRVQMLESALIEAINFLASLEESFSRLLVSNCWG